MDLVRHDSPCIQLVAFIAACSLLSSSDARQLADSLPYHFDGLKKRPALQYITGSNAVVCEEKMKEDPPTTYSSILNCIVTSVIHRAIPSTAHDRFYTKLVELGAKSVSEKVGNHISSMVAQNVNKMRCDMRETLRKGWKKWFATLSVVSASCAGIWWVHTNSLESILQYASSSNIMNASLYLNKMIKSVSTDRAVVLGMGLLGTVATIAATSNAHNLQLEFEYLSQVDTVKSKGGTATLGKDAVITTEKREKGIFESALLVNSFELCPPTTKQLQQVHAFMRDILPTNTCPNRPAAAITKIVLPECSDEMGNDQLLCICVLLVTLFAHRMTCRTQNYKWLLCVYYARLKALSKLKQ